MKFVVLGTSDFAIAAARGLCASGIELIAFITLRNELLPDNSADIPRAAVEFAVPCHEIEDVNSPSSISLLKSLNPDYLFVSWPKILHHEVLQIPKYYVIGTHPTELPKNRGRHPLHWSIVLGLSQVTLSFFRMEAGIDSGAILHKICFPIEETDDIAILNQKLAQIGEKGAKALGRMLLQNPSLIGEAQNHEKANYWRARTPHDGTIDFRLTADHISRLVRSFTLPYGCARVLFESSSIPIVRVTHPEDLPAPEAIRCMEPGRIISVSQHSFVVKAGDTLIQCEATHLPDDLHSAKHIFPPSYYLTKWGPETFFSMPQCPKGGES